MRENMWRGTLAFPHVLPHAQTPSVSSLTHTGPHHTVLLHHAHCLTHTLPTHKVVSQQLLCASHTHDIQLMVPVRNIWRKDRMFHCVGRHANLSLHDGLLGYVRWEADMHLLNDVVVAWVAPCAIMWEADVPSAKTYDNQ